MCIADVVCCEGQLCQIQLDHQTLGQLFMYFYKVEAMAAVKCSHESEHLLAEFVRNNDLSNH